MGMTKAFYFIRNRKQTQEELEQQLNGFKAVMQQYCIEDLRIYYGRGLGWFPVFSEELVWQAENLDEDLLKEMGNHFQAIVMALSVLDDDVVFLVVCKDGAVQKFVCADEGIIEDFGFDEEFSTDFPDVLCQCGFDGDSLRRVWSLDNYYESDLLYDMFDEMKTFPVFEPDEETPDGVSVIDGETVFDGE